MDSSDITVLSQGRADIHLLCYCNDHWELNCTLTWQLSDCTWTQ